MCTSLCNVQHQRLVHWIAAPRSCDIPELIAGGKRGPKVYNISYNTSRSLLFPIMVIRVVDFRVTFLALFRYVLRWWS